ncbi:hypothetical protein ACTXT7_000399 [Hymenolepis weldensis]
MNLAQHDERGRTRVTSCSRSKIMVTKYILGDLTDTPIRAVVIAFSTLPMHKGRRNFLETVLPFVTYALAFLLKGLDHCFIVLSGFGILVFRSELMLFYGPLLLFGLYFNLIRLRPALIFTGIITTLASLCLTVVIDSFFWQRWVWPEGEVFYFNAIENKSHLWASDSINRERRVFLGLELVALVFISIYSFLPHKELRFIIYALPIFNLLAAYFWTFAERRLHMCLDTRTARELSFKQKSRAKSYSIKHSQFISPIVHWICRLSILLCYSSLVFNFCISLGLVYVSYHNYPGGHAISRLNNWPGLSNRNDIHVYISNLAAQTGVNRFQEVHSNWM